MEIDATLYSPIYLPLVEKYIKRYFENSWLEQNNYTPENLTTPCTDNIGECVNKAYQDGLYEGLYEGLNNGFIEGFMECVKHFNNLELINKSDK